MFEVSILIPEIGKPIDRIYVDIAKLSKTRKSITDFTLLILLTCLYIRGGTRGGLGGYSPIEACKPPSEDESDF